MSRIKNPDILRIKVRKIEAKIRKIISSNRRWSDDLRLKEKVGLLLSDRACYLDSMFLATPEEIVRLEALNAMLLKKVENMHRRTSLRRYTELLREITYG